MEVVATQNTAHGETWKRQLHPIFTPVGDYSETDQNALNTLIIVLEMITCDHTNVQFKKKR